MDGHVVGEQVTGAIAVEQRRSQQCCQRVVVGAFGVTQGCPGSRLLT